MRVEGRDFVLALESTSSAHAELVPSSARASHAVAAPLPTHLEPLLRDAVDRAYDVGRRLLPPREPRSALEEARWEVDASQTPHRPTPAADTPAGALERELLQQSFQRARVYRPRLLLHGEEGMGQAQVAAALLHRLEGYAVQTLAVASLLGDSSQTPEAALVQQFHEARRLKPSILFVPELDRWPALLSDGVRESFRALLDSLQPDDAVLLVGVSSVPVWELAPELRAWFGVLPSTRIAVPAPDADARSEFATDIVRQAARPPTEFADALPRRRRVLAELPKAPPKPPRQPTQAELSQQVENDARILEHLKFRLGPVLAELRKKFKKFTRDVWVRAVLTQDEYNLRDLMEQFDWRREKGKVVITLRYDRRDHAEDRASSDEEQHSDAHDDAPEDFAPDGDAENTASDPPSAPASPHRAPEEAHAEAPEAPEAPAPSLPPDAPGPAAPDAVHHSPLPASPQEEPMDVAHASDAAPHGAEPAAPPATTPGALGGPPAPPAAALSQAENDSPYIYRDFTIYTMTLDKMQKRLYYNGYLTCDAFMDDISKIVSNAEEAREVDADRVFRARQMQNLATILLDQYFDAPFRAECERMAQRVLAREEQAKRDAELQKATEVHPRRPNGQRYSARRQGEVPEPQDLVDVGTLERAHKRGRSASAAAAHSEPAADADEPAKRTRLAPDAPPSGDEEPPEPPAPAPAPEPLLSADVQHSLVTAFVQATDGFNVEQLEQLRAACFDAILAHRAAWDRTALLAELHTLVEDVARAVRHVE